LELFDQLSSFGLDVGERVLAETRKSLMQIDKDVAELLRVSSEDVRRIVFKLVTSLQQPSANSNNSPLLLTEGSIPSFGTQLPDPVAGLVHNTIRNNSPADVGPFLSSYGAAYHWNAEYQFEPQWPQLSKPISPIRSTFHSPAGINLIVDPAEDQFFDAALLNACAPDTSTTYRSSHDLSRSSSRLGDATETGTEQTSLSLFAHCVCVAHSYECEQSGDQFCHCCFLWPEGHWMNDPYYAGRTDGATERFNQFRKTGLFNTPK
jgi:hypothetical protein